MAFVIKNIKGSTAMKIFQAILKVEAKSRFIFTMETTNNFTRIKISNVRLRESKHYCGNHPLPCPVRPFPTRHIHSKCLEGADWVAFNDMLNDVLDKLKVSADVASSLVIIRKGLERCTCYEAQAIPNSIDNEWVKDSGMFSNWIERKESKMSAYPNGTPGVPEYLTIKARKYKIVDHDEH